MVLPTTNRFIFFYSCSSVCLCFFLILSHPSVCTRYSLTKRPVWLRMHLVIHGSYKLIATFLFYGLFSSSLIFSSRQWCAINLNNPLSEEEKKKPWFVALASFRSVNVPTMINSKNDYVSQPTVKSSWQADAPLPLLLTNRSGKAHCLDLSYALLSQKETLLLWFPLPNMSSVISPREKCH